MGTSFCCTTLVPVVLGVVPNDTMLPKPVLYCLGVKRATENGSTAPTEVVVVA